jgi:putative addiction module component (TIGR02574 family)
MVMARTAAQLLEEALQLPEEQKAELTWGLLDSFGPPPAEDRSDEEWIAEIERRARAALSGEPGIPWEEARAEIRHRLASR